MRRKGQDVFVLGDEALDAELDGTDDSGSVWADEARDREMESVEGHDEVVSTTVHRRASSVPRHLAVLGLSVGAATVVVASTLLAGDGDSPSPSPPRRSSSVISPPPLEAATAARKVTAPSPPPPPHRVRRSVNHANRPRREVRSHRDSELQREPTHDEAQSSPVAMTPTTLSVPRVTPVPPASPPVRSPLPPDRGGGGSGGAEEFGFER